MSVALPCGYGILPVPASQAKCRAFSQRAMHAGYRLLMECAFI
jgi:hypothetical protein